MSLRFELCVPVTIANRVEIVVVERDLPYCQKI